MTSANEPKEFYRGILIQNYQSRERVEQRVIPEIDRVMAMTDIAELFGYCSDISCPPEARLLAAAMLKSIFSQAADDRRVRPNIDLELVEARVAGLDEGCTWRSPISYGCYCDDVSPPYTPGKPRPEMRPVELTDEQLASRRR